MSGPLTLGTMLGQFRVIGPLGAGGMGAVYRATDTVLRRDVALKVVEPAAPSELAAARLLREARRAASLSHPNICTVYHVADTGERPFIAMELVDGPTLYSEIRGGGVTVERACRIGRQIADALEHAHLHGVVHRDLKSTNVMLTASGHVKVVDFGIAGVLPGAGRSAETETSATDGAVAGTVPYMAPEVLRGQAADARSDLWSLGVVLFEMLAGRLPFSGTTASETVATILRDPLPALPRHVPPAVSHIVQRCLAKEPAERPGHASDVSLALEVAAISTPSAAPIPALLTPSVGRRPVIVVSVVALAAAVAGVTWLARTRAPEAVTAQVRLANPIQVTRAIGVEEHAVWSPDGRTLAYSASPTGDHQAPDWDVWVTQPGGTPLNRTADHPGRDMFPSWSPDGAQIAFWSSRDGAGCYVMPALGGAARRVAGAGAFDPHAPLWSRDGRQLSCVTGGPGEIALTTFVVDTGEVADRLPLRVDGRAMFLAESPDRRWVAMVVAPAGLNADITQLLIVSRPDGAVSPLSDGQTQIWSPSWSPDGALTYVLSAGGSAELWRQPFGLDRMPVGAPVVLSSGVGMRNASVSSDGTRVAYSQGRRVANLWRVPLQPDRAATWADATQITFDQAYIEFADVSPDGRQLAVSSDRAGSIDLWVLPSSGGEMRQVTSDRGAEWSPRWSPDGTVFAFYASRSGNRDLWTLPVAGGSWTQLTTNPGADLIPSWSPDGREIVHLSARDGTAYVWITPVHGGAGREVARAFFSGGKWSPDGRTIAFLSENGVGLRSADGRGPVSIIDAPAAQLIWSADGALFLAGWGDEGNNVYRVSATGREKRRITDLRGRRGGLVANSLASDGRYLYFAWHEDLGDIWVADLTP
jgi:Tol biopolymer transport system component/tRNA A-37 threonylcarbamoyl transferase component Bud32